MHGGPLRNYIFTRALRWHAYIFDDTHTPQGDFPVYALGKDDDDLVAEKDVQNKLITDSLPALWTAEFTYAEAPRTVYMLMDKDSLFVFWRAIQETLVSDAFTNTPPAFPMLVNPDDSPRETGWTDPEGVKRKPPPSESTGKTSSGSFASIFSFASGGTLPISQQTADTVTALMVAYAKLVVLGEPKATLDRFLTIVGKLSAGLNVSAPDLTFLNAELTKVVSLA
ncbi:MAG: hypothetical protein M3P26_17780 [Gemmatimonadota bacterium]|nr:hypothetical protein [Gemmatimonadota bacterium]